MEYLGVEVISELVIESQYRHVLAISTITLKI